MFLTLLDLGINFLLPFLTAIKGAKVPAEVVAAVQSAIDALIAHKQDVINMANLDAQRG